MLAVSSREQKGSEKGLFSPRFRARGHALMLSPLIQTDFGDDNDDDDDGIAAVDECACRVSDAVL